MSADIRLVFRALFPKNNAELDGNGILGQAHSAGRAPNTSPKEIKYETFRF